MAVKLIIDAGCDLNEVQAKEMGVVFVPMTIHFGDEEFLSGVTISHTSFYEKLVSAKELPTTSQPSPAVFENIYRQVKESGDEAVVLCVSSALSGTYQSACIAADGYEDSIYIVDTLAVSVAQKLLLDYAIVLKDRGMDARSIAAELDRKKADICAYGAVETLEYLIKGGRLSKTAGAIGSVLGIRPVLQLHNGGLTVAGKARGAKAAISMTHTLIDGLGVDFSMPFGVGYTGNDPQVITPYLEAENSVWKGRDVKICHVGSTVGTHTGPGLFIAAFFKKS